jgi:hypothetical protein
VILTQDVTEQFFCRLMLRSARSSPKNCIGGSPAGTGFDKSSGRAAAQVRLIVWCNACQHQVEPDPAEMAARRFSATVVTSNFDSEIPSSRTPPIAARPRTRGA